MQSDKNGCSTCPRGEERYEKFPVRRGRKTFTRYQYDWRDNDGELFTWVAESLKACRNRRDLWLEEKRKRIKEARE